MKKILIVFVCIVIVMAVFLLSCNSASPSKASMERGKQVYTQNCLPCHQADGSGVAQLNPPLKNTSYVLGDESKLIHIVINGLSDGVEINGDTYSNPMPPFGASLNDGEIADVLTYVRNSFGNKAGQISVDHVKALRK
ncbi:MAG: cytochrome c class [Chitinophagaceae bacterium]|nr:cytochrome c class [Chitinophagaceae bacterium]